MSEIIQLASHKYGWRTIVAVDVTITTIGSGFNRDKINTNFLNIEGALNDALSRSGGTPNSMAADIDMDSNDLLNAGMVTTERLVVDGEEFIFDEAMAKGDPGDAATITVGSVTTGAAGSSVSVTNSGTTSNAVLNFTIPRGDTGASGAGTGDLLAAQNLNDLANKATAFSNIKQDATESATGVVELATTAEAAAGVDTTRAVTAAGLTAFLAANPSSSNVQKFSSDGTWTKPSTGTIAWIYGWGGGGSGARATSGEGAGAGGGGSYNERIIPLASLSSSVAVVIGQGGAARTTNTNGLPGGNTTFGSYFTAYGGGGGSEAGASGGGGGGGGQGGAGSTGGADGGNGGVTGSGQAGGAGGSSGDSSPGLSSIYGGGGGGDGASGVGGAGGASEFGGGGGGGGSGTGTVGGAGGKSYWGGAGGGGGGNTTGGAAGTSVYGGNGGAGSTGTTVAGSGSVPGGGGGGSENANSGAGAAGELWVIVI